MAHSRNKIDSDWFKDVLDAKNKSMRGLARHLGVNASGVSRMISGQRKMRMDEANQIALYLGEPVNEVLAHAGVRPNDVEQKVMLCATIDEDGKITSLEEPTILPQDIADRAQAAIGQFRDETINAIQVRAEHGPLAVWDDAVIIYVENGIIDPAAVGSLSICQTKEGKRVMGRIEKARKTGEATIKLQDGKSIEAALAWAAPVVAIIP